MTTKQKLFADLIKSRSGELIYLSRGRDKGRAAWYYVLVDRMKVPLFLNEYKTPGGMIDLRDFGEVIESGWGENPPENVVQRIKIQFG